MKLKQLLSKAINRNKKKVIYLSKDTKINKNEKVDIILSPIFYWVKKEKISLKKERDAQKVASSIFDGEFDNFEEFKYLAIKYSDEEYIFIAYNPKEILEKLESDFGIKEINIGNIYTAQSEFYNIEYPLSVSRKQMVVGIDGIVSEIPKHSFDSATIYVNEFLTKNDRTKYSLKYKGVRGGGDNLIIASILSFALIIYFSLDILKLNKDLETINFEVEQKRENYKLPSTSFQIDSIKTRYKTIEKEQTKIRESIYWLQDKRFSKYGKINYLTLNRKGLMFKLEIKKGQSLNKIKSLLQERDKSVEFNEKRNILEVSFKR